MNITSISNGTHRSKKLLMVIFLSVCSSAVIADELDAFAVAINSAWSSTNDTQIVTLINQRLSHNSNDVAALSVKMYYHLWVDGNVTNAQSVAAQISALVNTSTNQAAKVVFSEMKAGVDNIPLSESGPLTAAALNQLRRETGGVFPEIRLCVWLAKTQPSP